MKESLKLLVAEDRDDEIVLLKHAFGRTKVKFDTQFVRDGDEAMSYLAGIGQFAERRRFPVPMLTDLKMPRMNGFELLHWVRSQRGLDGLVVVVLSSSDERVDVNRAYALGANSYLVKPSSPSNFLSWCSGWNTTGVGSTNLLNPEPARWLRQELLDEYINAHKSSSACNWGQWP